MLFDESYGLGVLYSNLRQNRQAKEHLDKAVGVSIAIGDRELEAKATVGLAHVSDSINDSQTAKETIFLPSFFPILMISSHQTCK